MGPKGLTVSGRCTSASFPGELYPNWRTGTIRRKGHEPLGYLSKLFPSLIRLSVAASLRRKTLVTADGLTKEMCVSVYLYAKEVKRLYKASGALFLALYLKQALFCLWSRRPHDRLPVPVSLTRSGFPRIIPSFIRRQKYKKDDKADMLVKIWLSLFI